MSTVVVDSKVVHIPPWVVDLDSFRRWADEDEFPDNGRICFLNGEVWVDMSKQQVFTHGIVKNEFAFKLTGLIEAEGLGRYYPDGIYVSNDDANIANIPDGSFSSHESIREGRVRLVQGEEGGFVELEGSPDMVLEIVSDSSASKDKKWLRQSYWEAGIREYWLVDVRGDPLQFDILRYSVRGYVTTKKQDGWLKSQVFGRSFHLSQQAGADGHPKYTLDVRPS